MYLDGPRAFMPEQAPDAVAADTLSIALCEARGLGVVTGRAATAGAVLDRFAGTIDGELRQHSLQVSPGRHISGTRFIGFLSHSCAPNCRLDMERFELVALADIPAGGWLTIDYAATEDVLYRQFACRCGAPRCRRWITGRRELPSAEGLRHLSAHWPE